MKQVHFHWLLHFVILFYIVQDILKLFLETSVIYVLLFRSVLFNLQIFGDFSGFLSVIDF